MILAAWPLAGRTRELELIADTIEGSRHGGILIGGASGTGKSRLAAEALAVARCRGCVTLEAVATRAASDIPFGALAHLLPAPRGGPSSLLGVLRQVRSALLEQARGRRLVLLVDDAHLLDDGSAALLHQLATNHAGFALLTVRSGERCPSTVESLWKDGIAPRIELMPLLDETVGDLIGRVLGGDVDGWTQHELVRVASGNMLFLRELLHSGLSSGMLSCAGSVWRWHGPMVPDGALRGLIEDRVRAAGPEARRLLEAVAIAEPLGPTLLRALGSDALAAQCETAGLLATERDGARTHVRLAHPLYAEVVRATTGGLRAREIQLRLAGALEATGARRQDDVLRLATWRLEAGTTPRSRVLAAAAARALESADFVLAERLARAAVDGGGGFDPRVVLAHALMAQRRAAEAEEVLAAIPGATDREVARAAMTRAVNLFWGLGRTDEAQAVIRRARSEVADPGERTELSATGAISLFCLGRPAEAVAQAAAVLRSPDHGPASAALALTVTSACEALMGRTAAALASVDRGLATLEGMHEAHAPADHHFRLSQWMALLLNGRLREADELAGAGYAASLRAGAEHARGQWCYQLGTGALWSGRVRTAVGWLEQAAVLCQEHDPSYVLTLSLATLAEAAALAGDPDRASAALAAVVNVLPHERAWLQLSEAWVTAARGEAGCARTVALRAAGVAAEQGFLALEAWTLHCVARLGDPAPVRDRLAALVPAVEGTLVPLLADHAAALHSGDGGDLAAVAGRFERLGALLLAAEAWTAAAHAHRRSGRAAHSRTAELRARALAAQCEGAVTPALAEANPSGMLTGREREVARLAATGLASRVIATRLGLSVRTVDNHLQRVYSKLAVHGRRELDAALQPSRMVPSRHIR